jgi:hypothetical protein
VRFVECGRCVRFVRLAGVSGCVNGGLVSVQTRFAFSFSPNSSVLPTVSKGTGRVSLVLLFGSYLK